MTFTCLILLAVGYASGFSTAMVAVAVVRQRERNQQFYRMMRARNQGPS